MFRFKVSLFAIQDGSLLSILYCCHRSVIMFYGIGHQKAPTCSMVNAAVCKLSGVAYNNIYVFHAAKNPVENMEGVMCKEVTTGRFSVRLYIPRGNADRCCEPWPGQHCARRCCYGEGPRMMPGIATFDSTRLSTFTSRNVYYNSHQC